MEEVHVGAVDLGAELVERVHPRLARAPVVALGPVRDELLQVLALGAVVPARVGDLLREPGAPQPLAQVAEHAVVDVDPERLERQPHCAQYPSSMPSATGSRPS